MAEVNSPKVSEGVHPGSVDLSEVASAFTPGPWTAWQSPEGRWVIKSTWPQSGLRLTAFLATMVSADQNNEANARLISAAPSMLAALKSIADESVFNQMRFAEDTDTDYFLRCFKAVKDAARAALAQAEAVAK